MGCGKVIDMDKTTVCTLALSRLGEQEYKEDTATFKPCEKWYTFVLRRAAARYNWTFTKRRVVLARDEESGRYEYPLDCLKLVKFWSGGEEVRDVELRADGIYVTGEEGKAPPGELEVTYQSDLVGLKGELPDKAPEFCEGVICMLASRVAMELGTQGQLSQVLAEEAERHFADAIATDRQQDWSIWSKQFGKNKGRKSVWER